MSQTVVVRANDEAVAMFLGPKQIAGHRRSWSIGEDIEHPSHKDGLLERKPRAAAGRLPPALAGHGEAGIAYFKTFAAGHPSVQRETERLVFLIEFFGESPTRDAMAEVMATGHVGAEYIEYVLRQEKRLTPAPLRLGDPVLAALSFGEPDLSIYDQLVPAPMTRDPGTPPTPEDSDEA